VSAEDAFAGRIFLDVFDRVSSRREARSVDRQELIFLARRKIRTAANALAISVTDSVINSTPIVGGR
jgi:hypothetical protein